MFSQSLPESRVYIQMFIHVPCVEGTLYLVGLTALNAGITLSSVIIAITINNNDVDDQMRIYELICLLGLFPNLIITIQLTYIYRSQLKEDSPPGNDKLFLADIHPKSIAASY